MVVNWAPQAAGAGVAEVMAYLNGCMLPHVSTSSPLSCNFILCALESAHADCDEKNCCCGSTRVGIVQAQYLQQEVEESMLGNVRVISPAEWVSRAAYDQAMLW